VTGADARRPLPAPDGWPATDPPRVDFALSPRSPGSVRRTTTHDSVRPDGLLGPVTVLARGRDLFTGQGLKVAVLDEASIELRALYREGSILSLSSDPAEPALESLVGSTPFSGFRASVEALLPHEQVARTVRFRVLYDLPPALLASGRALRVAGVPVEMSGKARNPVGVCAGWAEGGTLLAGLTEAGPPLHIGPDATSLSPIGDPLAWHVAAPLPAHGTRRARRLDLWERDGSVHLEAYFRDSHVDEHGRETVVHEYGVRGALDPEQERFLWCAAVPGALPYPECPSAAESAGRLVGMRPADLTTLVQQEFVGPSTCTHLNDTFRCLGDSGALLRLLRESVTASA